MSPVTSIKKSKYRPRKIIENPRKYAKTLSDVLANLDFDTVEAIAHLIADVGLRQAQVLLIGNGGSASNASHYHCDLTSAFRTYQSRLRVLNLAGSPSIITALGNDFDFRKIFSFQVKETGNPGDLLLMLTASGNSPDILEACATAQDLSIKTISITGFGGGKVASMADLNLTIPSNNYGVIEDVQLVLGHMFSQKICGLFEDKIDV
ncbi:MAG: SIS domain-containing protein [Moorea sp. SIO4A3]|nr:SIS domain-containing protein [Moorena sp. SIO4A3]